jgi:hypothetical protein
MEVKDGGLTARLDWLSGELKSTGNKHRYTAPIDEAMAELARLRAALAEAEGRAATLERERDALLRWTVVECRGDMAGSWLVPTIGVHPGTPLPTKIAYGSREEATAAVRAAAGLDAKGVE